MSIFGARFPFPFDLKPGEWTDDTSMALCLAASLVEKNGFDPVDQMQRYIARGFARIASWSMTTFKIAVVCAGVCHPRNRIPWVFMFEVGPMHALPHYEVGVCIKTFVQNESRVVDAATARPC